MSEAPPQTKPIVGMLHMGDLGSALATLLLRHGFEVITCCHDRSAATQQRARDSGAKIAASYEDFVRRAELVISLVSPSAALETARRYAALANIRPERGLFLDANSIDLASLREIEGALSAAGVEVVDASIHGGAKRLEELAVLYLSGPGAEGIAAGLRGVMDLQVVGPILGQAKTTKLLLGGISKSLNALFLEISAVANHAGMSEVFLDSCKQFYPGLMTAIERMLPTYPMHAARRVDELNSIGHLAAEHGMHADMIAAAGQTIARFAELDCDDQQLSGTTDDLRQIIALAARSQSATNHSTTKASP